jgi:hypothetical protein
MRTNLGQMITEIQRAVSGVPTPDLRSEIQIELERLDDHVAAVHALHPGVDVLARINATSDFMATVINVSLLVRELATRPIDQLPPVDVFPN